MRLLLPLLLCLAAVPVGAAPARSPFAGSYIEAYPLASGSAPGPYSGGSAITIGNGGRVSGRSQWVYFTAALSDVWEFRYTGSIADDGTMNVKVTVEEEYDLSPIPDYPGSGYSFRSRYTITLSGHAELDAEGNLLLDGALLWYRQA